MTYEEAVEAVGREMYGDFVDSGNRLRLQLNRLSDARIRVSDEAVYERDKWSECWHEQVFLEKQVLEKMNRG